jgi:hypothetical protein
MKYKQCLFFVAKCLTLDHHPERITEVRDLIKGGSVNWEKVVSLSSGQLVMPAMFIQLKRNGLLANLPSDLVDYLEDITEMNRKRNLAILDQIIDIVKILNRNNISPVFLKGTAHLLCSLYTDIGERMIGDIDLLVPGDKMIEAANILIGQGYKPMSGYKSEMYKDLKHFPRLQNFNYQASVEIHKEILDPPNQKIFRGCDVIKNRQPVALFTNEVFIPSLADMIIHNVYNSQISDKAYVYRNILLRQMYDLLLLSLKSDIQRLIYNQKKRHNIFNTYYAIISFVFALPNGLSYQKNFCTSLYLKNLDFFLSYPKYIPRIYRSVIYVLWRVSRYLTLPLQAIFSNDTRKLIFYRLIDKKWYSAHFQSYIRFLKNN